ncbi:hypothetical protein [Paenibacillus macquariensis]|uniref:Uncharacterized protein n=1 Tax=Paenibacillus macquariensis TaxID=948756 RepID=A0ABY1JKB7_9BACL|nr:hypothetical protein [Paenibacillus macquariensis]MEC0089896.1 hypothetical protein [Paenibacillus macquariensis]OAB30643.1 hypothetical protein PMSM_21060 [Paenibacillus macquariensis subsp. macquariensis]SIQ33828.1 hypothetical protein SAMN05421578_101282 [Paenibacillus macquariensis]
MEGFASILILLSMFGVFLSLIGTVKGSIKLLKIKGRKNSSFLLIACFVLFIIGGSLLPVDDSTVAQTNTSQKEKSVVTQAGNAKSTAISEASNSDGIKPTENKKVVVLPSKEVQKVTETLTAPTGVCCSS